MTREDAKIIGVTTVPNRGLEYVWYENYVNKIDKIYNDFEGRTCESCKFYDGYACNNENSIAYGADNRIYEDDGCLKEWEQK